MTAFGTNAILAFIMAITLIFCVGDVAAVTAETSLTPFVVIFYNSTKSKAGTVVMVLPVILTFWAALVSQLATASRQLWAFARDGGIPWAPYLAPVRTLTYAQVTPRLGWNADVQYERRSTITRSRAEQSGCLSPSLASFHSSTSAP